MNRVFTFIESDLSETRKKFLNFHFHGEFCKKLKVDFIPQGKERTILILAEKFGKVHNETIDLIPFDYILIVDPEKDNYTCSIINGKKVIHIPLEPIIFLQIAQGMGVKIDSLFLSNVDDNLFDFLLEMCFPLFNEEFVLITNSKRDNKEHPKSFEDKIKTLPFEVVHKIEKSNYKQFDFFMFMTKTNESKSYTINGKLVTITNMSFWNHIDTSLEVHFTTFNEEWSEYLIRLYESDIYDLNGVYTDLNGVCSADEKIYNLKIMDDFIALINQCEFRVIGITINPRIYEQIFKIIMSENQVQEIYIYGFFD